MPDNEKLSSPLPPPENAAPADSAYLVRLVKRKNVGVRLFFRVGSFFLYLLLPAVFLFFSLTKSNPVLLLLGLLLTAAAVVLCETFLCEETEFSVEANVLSVVKLFGKRFRREQFEEDIKSASVFWKAVSAEDPDLQKILAKPDLYLCRALPTPRVKTFSALYLPSDTAQDVLFLFPADPAVTAFLLPKLSPLCKIR